MKLYKQKQIKTIKLKHKYYNLRLKEVRNSFFGLGVYLSNQNFTWKKSLDFLDTTPSFQHMTNTKFFIAFPATDKEILLWEGITSVN